LLSETGAPLTAGPSQSPPGGLEGIRKRHERGRPETHIANQPDRSAAMKYLTNLKHLNAGELLSLATLLAVAAIIGYNLFA
jgi:hypothetical protein